MGIFLQFKRHFHEQSYFSVTVIHLQFFLYIYLTFLVQETASKKEAGRINLINA